METITVKLANPSVYKLFEDMEQLGLIRIVKDNPDAPPVTIAAEAGLTEEEIEKRLNEIRREWQRDML